MMAGMPSLVDPTVVPGGGYVPPLPPGYVPPPPTSNPYPGLNIIYGVNGPSWVGDPELNPFKNGVPNAQNNNVQQWSPYHQRTPPRSATQTQNPPSPWGANQPNNPPSPWHANQPLNPPSPWHANQPPNLPGQWAANQPPNPSSSWPTDQPIASAAALHTSGVNWPGTATHPYNNNNVISPGDPPSPSWPAAHSPWESQATPSTSWSAPSTAPWSSFPNTPTSANAPAWADPTAAFAGGVGGGEPISAGGFGAVPSGYGHTPGGPGPPPGSFGTAPGGFGGASSGFGAAPGGFGGAPSGVGAAPGGFGVTPGGFGATPSGPGPPPGSFGSGAAPSGFGAAPPGGFGSAPTGQPGFPPTFDQPHRSRSHKRRNSDAAPRARSSSRHGSIFPDLELTRSLSHGRNASVPVAHDAWPNDPQPNRRPPVPRPRDWRTAYEPANSPIPFLNVNWSNKSHSLVEERRDDTSRTLCPALAYKKRTPSLQLDLRFDPLTQQSPFFSFFGRHATQQDFMKPATHPGANFLRIFHKDLPWYIDITPQSGHAAVTILDVLTQMHASLSSMIHDSHFYTEALSDEDRARVTQAFRSRCGSNMAEMSQGVHRIDFLGPKVLFLGLGRKNGMYEMKLSTI